MRSRDIKDWAGQLGFDLVGVAPAESIEYGDAMREYLARGYHGQMGYLERNVEKRIDPRRLLPWARSIICTALNYYTPSYVTQEHAKTARFAWGSDYHEVVRGRLDQLAEKIRSAAGGDVRARCFVDTAPLAEKAHAARAGLGWIGKNTLLINEKFGSWLVLGEIVTELELEADSPVPDRCGDCMRCLEACPASALVQPRILEGRKCVSYRTIELKDEVPGQIPASVTEWRFGCDVCQEVCPFNQNPVATTISEFMAPRR